MIASPHTGTLSGVRARPYVRQGRRRPEPGFENVRLELWSPRYTTSQSLWVRLHLEGRLAHRVGSARLRGLEIVCVHNP